MKIVFSLCLLLAPAASAAEGRPAFVSFDPAQLSEVRAGVAALKASSIFEAGELPSAEQWQAAGFRETSIERISSEEIYAHTASFETKGTASLYFLMLRGDWTRQAFEKHLAAIASTYSRCGVRFDATLIEADAPHGVKKFVKWTHDGDETLHALVQETPLKKRPLFYLVDGFSDVPEVDDGGSSFSCRDFDTGSCVGYSDSRGEKTDPVMFDTLFIPAAVDSPDHLKEIEASPYDAPAHELWHVLSRETLHSRIDPPNISNIWRERSDLILPEDCAKILASPFVVKPGP